MSQPLLADILAARAPVIEQALRASLDLPADPNLPLYGMMRHQLGWVDEMGEARAAERPRLLGSLCIEACDALSGGGAAAPAAAAIELFRESTRVHEDMQTATQRRDGRDAVWWAWGPAQAINVGDGLHALALLTLMRAQDSLGADAALAATAVLDAAALSYYEGQHLDLQLQERVDVVESQHQRLARGKHGALFGGALALGALCAGANDATVASWRDAGVALGAGALVAAEARVFWGGEPGGGDDAGRALSKSKLYPVVAALTGGSLAQKRELGAYYFKRVIEPGDLDAIRAVLDAAGAREKTAQAMEAARTETLDALKAAGADSGALSRWETIIDALVTMP